MECHYYKKLNDAQGRGRNTQGTTNVKNARSKRMLCKDALQGCSIDCMSYLCPRERMETYMPSKGMTYLESVYGRVLDRKLNMSMGASTYLRWYAANQNTPWSRTCSLHDPAVHLA
jgi:hypothetical protein